MRRLDANDADQMSLGSTVAPFDTTTPVFSRHGDGRRTTGDGEEECNLISVEKKSEWHKEKRRERERERERGDSVFLRLANEESMI